MNRHPHATLGLALPLALLLTAAGAVAQGQDAPPPPVDREKMWPAPTQEDWEKPCLIQWQRSYEDALAVSKETRKPILVCVNMDGEIASEHYAGIRYRQPEIAALYEPYVCVIASVYRHSPRDFDEEGHRVPCPRFGSVTCGEHIAIEPGLFDQFFEGQRVAPRHIAVELDSAEMYDVYYAWDTDTIFDSLRDGVAERDVPTRDLRHDLPIVERVASPDSVDRAAVEQAYREGDREERRALLEAARTQRRVRHVDLLRLAVYDVDLDLRQMAWRTLADSAPEPAVDLIAEALEAKPDDLERDSLIAALEQIGDASPRARRLASVHRALVASAGAVDAARWAGAPDDPAANPDAAALDTRLQERSAAAAARPGDPATLAELAQALLERALVPGIDPKFAELLLSDARQAAREAAQLGYAGWRAEAVLAIAGQELGEDDEAYARAEAAYRALPPGEHGLLATRVLGLFADARRRAILSALRRGESWPPEWLTEVHTAYGALRHHPAGTDVQVRAHYDFLRMLGARGYAEEVLEDGLARFPDSWVLHDRLRGRILETKGLGQGGLGGLEAAYEERLRPADAPPHLHWFAGYASLVAAEYHRRANRPEEALAAYGRAIGHYEASITANPDTTDTANHYIAVALGGQAKLSLELGELERAVEEVLASMERRPEAAASLDGLGISTVGTARMLLARLQTEGQDELAARVQAALDALDPELLQLPEFERGGRPSPDAVRSGRGRGRRDR